MRKIKYLLTVAALSSTMMFGCGSNDKDAANDNNDNSSSVSIDTIVDGIDNADLDVNSLDFCVSLNLDASVEADEDSQTMKLNGKVDGSVDNEAGLGYITADINMDDISQTVTSYIDYSDLEDVVVYVEQQGVWLKQSVSDSDVSFDPESITETSDSQSIKSLVESLKDVTAKETDKYYVISGKIDTAKATESLGDIAENAGSLGAAVDSYASILEDIDVNIEISVNKDDFSFANAKISIENFETEFMGATLKINSAVIEFSVKNYNNVDTITIPDEAKDAISIDEMGSLNF